jgi:hypothetical protein
VAPIEGVTRTTTTTTNPYPGGPLPAGADEASDWWEENTDADMADRWIAH